MGLDAVPFEALEALVRTSDQRPLPGGRPLLLVTPNLVKLGRAAEAVAALPLADWLQKNAPAFHRAFEAVRQRRGKTILRESVGRPRRRPELESRPGKNAGRPRRAVANAMRQLKAEYRLEIEDISS